MGQLLMHPTTKFRIEAAIRVHPHALLITGPTGSGKEAMARYLAEQILETTDVNGYPYFLQISPTKQSIGIESVRAIRNFMQRRTIGKGAIRRIILLTEAQLITSEAQNALLKSLEEPPADTMIILTCPDINLLKPTILSRVYTLPIEPLSLASVLDHLQAEGYDAAQITSAYYMSAGRAGLLAALLEQKSEHPLVEAIDHAKQILQLKPYERLVQVDSLIKDREQLAVLFEGFERLASSGLQQAALKGNHAAARKFHSISERIQSAAGLLSQNANLKLLLTNLLLEI